ncbi:MAG: hypothetical protein HY873_09030 [Chloroflexi bacterium]|nr:hypothetical protein [Chloroflexota bacterium]
MLTPNGLFSEEIAAAVQIERELETEDLVLISQLRRAVRAAGKAAKAQPSIPYVAKPSLNKPGATIAAGR